MSLGRAAAILVQFSTSEVQSASFILVTDSICLCSSTGSPLSIASSRDGPEGSNRGNLFGRDWMLDRGKADIAGVELGQV